MPCYDGGRRDRERDERNRAEKVEAMLCGILAAIERQGNLDYVLMRFDHREAGISRVELREWWRSHKAADDARRQREGK